MKIVIIGGTGFVGSEVLSQCRRNTSITSIVVLTRRPLFTDLQQDPKIISVVTEDFSALSEVVKTQLRGSSAAIWALRATSRQVELDWPLAFVRTMRSLQDSAGLFRYVHVSGVLAEKDQEKPLWFLQEGRRVKGLAEVQLRELAVQGSWETYVVRPSMIVPNPPGVINMVAGWILGAVRVDRLARVMLDIVGKGAELHTFENADLNRYADRLVV